MSFNSEKIANANYESAKEYLTRYIEKSEVPNSINKLKEIIDECGPVVDAYPAWHPLGNCYGGGRNRDPRRLRKYLATPHSRWELDHSVYLRNGIITCPYTKSSNVKEIIDSIDALPKNHFFDITWEYIDDVQFYNHSPATTPLLIRCEYGGTEDADGRFHASWVIPLILEEELPNWRAMEGAAAWEDMCGYFLGSPHGDNSSLFVSQETGKAVEEIWNILINQEVFGLSSAY